MCVVENSGRFGGTYAAPIVGLMIEKYLKDSITDPKRIARINQLSELNLIPARIYSEIRRQDSLSHSKDSAYLIEKGYIRILKDSLEVDETDEINDVKAQKDSIKTKKELPGKDSADSKINTPAALPDEKKKNNIKDSINNQ